MSQNATISIDQNYRTMQSVELPTVKKKKKKKKKIENLSEYIQYYF